MKDRDMQQFVGDMDDLDVQFGDRQKGCSLLILATVLFWVSTCLLVAWMVMR